MVATREMGLLEPSVKTGGAFGRTSMSQCVDNRGCSNNPIDDRWAPRRWSPCLPGVRNK